MKAYWVVENFKVVNKIIINDEDYNHFKSIYPQLFLCEDPELSREIDIGWDYVNGQFKKPENTNG